MPPDPHPADRPPREDPHTAATGHAVLVVPVVELEPFVRGRWQHYDPAMVSVDPGFTHAHITALAPYLDAPGPTDLAVLARIAAQTPAFDFVLDGVTAFPDGIIHTVPEPAGPFARLTARLWEAFPQCPPYAGRYDDLVPHLTLDHTGAGVSVADTAAALRTVLPARCRAERLELHWYAPDGGRVLASWALGEPAADRAVGCAGQSCSIPVESGNPVRIRD